ncbi:hypothetical protein L1987_53408 [Smallanthus sonchifolius]|uniref:Uncharacterized protein n=1 Tax=Smallanthus sonchifolius TaxID=185202 RepID=A0ACB9EWL6_9ASTR|nr:hypothetical protein L1987_53408 [Smallanthus sonchifolius]
MDSEMERKMLEQYQEINIRLDSHNENMKSIQISIRELTEGLKFLITKANKEPSDDGSYVFNSEGDSVDLSNGESDYEGDDETLASALAISSCYDDMNETDVSQSSEPVFRKIEAIKRFMHSSRENLIAVSLQLDQYS